MNQSSVSNVRSGDSSGKLVGRPRSSCSGRTAEIRLRFGPRESREQESISVTMRTPGHDFELALGFLRQKVSYNIRKTCTRFRYCTDGGRKGRAGEHCPGGIERSSTETLRASNDTFIPPRVAACAEKPWKRFISFVLLHKVHMPRISN